MVVCFIFFRLCLFLCLWVVWCGSLVWGCGFCLVWFGGVVYSRLFWCLGCGLLGPFLFYFVGCGVVVESGCVWLFIFICFLVCDVFIIIWLLIVFVCLLNYDSSVVCFSLFLVSYVGHIFCSFSQCV